MSKTLRTLVIVIIFYGLHYLLYEFYFSEIRNAIHSLLHSILACQVLTYLITGIPLFIGVIMVKEGSGFFNRLGLDQSIFKALAFALACTLPMLIGYGFVFEFDKQVTFSKMLTGAVYAAFFEEVYYRGFLFGLIYRYTKIGFIPAIIFGALIFATGHLYQSEDFSTLVGIFLVTFLGAGLFAWSYVEWEMNLWVPIFLHLFMNLFWMLFSAGDTALGGFYSNLFRIVTITLIIVITIIYKKRRKLKLTINRKTVWMKD